MNKCFCKVSELIGLIYVDSLLGSSTILIIENNEKYRFHWSIPANLLPCKNIHSNRVSNYWQSFGDLKTQGFAFTNGFKCSDVHKIEKLNNFFT